MCIAIGERERGGERERDIEQERGGQSERKTALLPQRAGHDPWDMSALCLGTGVMGKAGVMHSKT